MPFPKLPFLAFLLLLGACNHYYYAPNVLHQPLLKQQHDASVRGGLGLGSGYVGLDVQAAYSPVRHGALMYNYFSIDGSTTTRLNTSRQIRGYLHEGALGGYFDLSDAAQFSIYGGLGRGRVYNQYSEEGVTSDIELERWFAQPGLIIYDDRLRFNLGLRISYVAYGDGYFDTRLEGPEREELLAVAANSPDLLFETGLGFSMRLRPIVLSLNFVNSQTREQEFAYKRGYSNVSLALDIHDLWRRKKKDLTTE
jgi:hypothetical protein